MTCRILCCDVREGLAQLDDESAHCVVTSPPYYGLRAYAGVEPQVWGGVQECEHEWEEHERGLNNRHAVALARGDEGTEKGGTTNHRDFRLKTDFCRRCGAWRGHLGLEPSLAMYLDHMVEIFRDLRRVLRRDGTCWLNIGDSYAGSWGAQSRRETPATLSRNQINNHPKKASHTGSIRDAGLKPKDLMLIPARLAIRLQDDGWWVRKDIILAKRAPMPESCEDRPTSSHEHLFLLTKAPRYFWDRIAVLEKFETEEKESYPARAKIIGRGQQEFALARGNDQDKSGGFPPNGSGRNMRDVWWLSPAPFNDTHFATFVSEIPRRAILAGTSAKGVCPKCGAPWVRIIKKTQVRPIDYEGKWLDADPQAASRRMLANVRARRMNGEPHDNPFPRAETIGWRAGCSCEVGDPVPATVLDPFLGSGTTALVAAGLGRDCVGIELSREYAAMARERASLTKVECDADVPHRPLPGPLFAGA